MFNKKPKPQYHLDIKTYSIDAPKIVKTKSILKLKKIIAASLATLFLSVTLSASIAVPAQAENNGSCFLDATDNTWAGNMGGMLTSMVNPSKETKTTFFNQASTSSLTAVEQEAAPTMRDKYGEQIRFVTWIPAIRDGGEASENANIWAGIKKDATWNSTRSDYSFGSIWVADKSSSIRKGEVNDRGAFDINCGLSQAGAEWSDVAPNFFFQMAKGINSITTFLYVNATTGSNISDVVGLNTTSIASSPDQVLQHDATKQQDSWAYNFGSSIQEVLTGTARDGTPTGSKGLYSDLYLNFLLPIILIGTVVVLLNAIRARAIKALSGIVWMVVAIISGMLLLQRPMMIPEVVDGLVGTVSTEVNRAIIGKSDLAACDIPDNVTGAYSSATKRESKEMECYIWYYTIYIPWAEGQFGVQSYDKAANSDHQSSVFFYEDTANASVLKGASGDIPIGYNIVNASSSNLGWPLYMLEYMERPQGANVAIAQSKAITANIGTIDTGGHSKWFAGGDRIGASLLALAVSLSAGIFISVNSSLIIGYQIAMLLLLMIAPVFLLIGAIPSQMGKGIGLRWAELIVGIAVKRMVIVLLMAVFIKMFIIVAGIDNIGIGFQIIIFTVLSYLGITKRSEIMEMFTGYINFGGNKSLSTEGVENVGKNAGKIALGGALAGAAVATRLGKKGVSATAAATGRGVKNANFNRGVKKNQRKMFDAKDDSERQVIATKINRRNTKRDERDIALGRRSIGGNGDGSNGGVTITEQGKRKVRSGRQAARAHVSKQFENGNIDWNDKTLRPPTVKEKAKKNFETIKASPSKIKEGTKRTINATKAFTKETSEATKDTVWSIKKAISPKPLPPQRPISPKG